MSKKNKISRSKIALYVSIAVFLTMAQITVTRLLSVHINRAAIAAIEVIVNVIIFSITHDAIFDNPLYEIFNHTPIEKKERKIKLTNILAYLLIPISFLAILGIASIPWPIGPILSFITTMGVLMVISKLHDITERDEMELCKLEYEASALKAAKNMNLSTDDNNSDDKEDKDVYLNENMDDDEQIQQKLIKYKTICPAIKSQINRALNQIERYERLKKLIDSFKETAYRKTAFSTLEQDYRETHDVLYRNFNDIITICIAIEAKGERKPSDRAIDSIEREIADNNRRLDTFSELFEVIATSSIQNEDAFSNLDLNSSIKAFENFKKLKDIDYTSPTTGTH